MLGQLPNRNFLSFCIYPKHIIEEHIIDALQALKEGKTTNLIEARRFSIPYHTLYSQYYRTRGQKRNGRGTLQAIPLKDEKELVLYLPNHPERIWNLDATNLCFDPVRTKVVGETNIPCSRTINGSDKDNTTILFACNTAGGKAPLLIMFKGMSIWDEWLAEESCKYRVPSLWFENAKKSVFKFFWPEVEVITSNEALKRLVTKENKKMREGKSQSTLDDENNASAMEGDPVSIQKKRGRPKKKVEVLIDEAVEESLNDEENCEDSFHLNHSDMSDAGTFFSSVKDDDLVGDTAWIPKQDVMRQVIRNSLETTSRQSKLFSFDGSILQTYENMY
ncbi:hypothetical protein PGB90_001933 [Kerria lacca]